MLVQAAPTAAETRATCWRSPPRRHVRRAAVVGWVGFEAPDAAERIAKPLAGDPNLLGLRPMLQDLADDAWILRPRGRPALDAIEAAGLRFDALVTPRHLPAPRAASWPRRPELKRVFDHGQARHRRRRDSAGWAAAVAVDRGRDIQRDLQALRPGLPGRRRLDRASGLKPFVECAPRGVRARQADVGQQNWPVVTEAGGYAAWRAAATALTAQLCAGRAPRWIFGGAAPAFVRIRRMKLDRRRHPARRRLRRRPGWAGRRWTDGPRVVAARDDYELFDLSRHRAHRERPPIDLHRTPAATVRCPRRPSG